MPQGETHNRFWWLVPVAAAVFLAACLVASCMVSEVAREVLAKAFFNILGAVGTPFILEITCAIVGLFALLMYNHYRLQKEGDGWVYLAQTEPDAASLAEGAETPPHRLDSVVLPEQPDLNADLQARLATIEGYLELGLKQEALEQLQQMPPAELELAPVRKLLTAAQVG